MPIKQDNRLLAINTSLGPDVLAVRSIKLEEAISQLFELEAELASDNAEVDFDKVIGKAVTIRLNVGQKEKRFFNGIVSRLVQVANKGGYASYRATIVPWLWMLTRTSDCRIFMEKTVPEIIEEVFKDHDPKDYQLKLSGSYEKKEYCVQYRETDFNFVSRLMEQEGIYYYFEHKDGKHTMVLADAISAHKAFDGYAEVIFHPLEKGAAGRECITNWSVEKEVQPVAYALNDFDFKKPKASLNASTNLSRKYGLAHTEIYDYPGEYVEHGDGERLADVRLNELQSQYEILSGQANARGLATGCVFKLKNHPRGDQNRDYLITSTEMNVDAGDFAAGNAAAGSGEFFSCNFTAIDKAQQFRAGRVTPKPIVQGPQTAIVVGPGGEEIHTDEHARVKVQFHWDRYGKADENSSCWIRVSQFWAGKEWGSMHIPRIGQEVIIEFLEGDPDRPIITGRVYNGEQVPPYGLPANKTQSGIKSRSTLGGSGKNFNELRFEDKKGGEEIFLHGEKDWTIKIKNNESETVGSNISTNAGGNISRNAGANISRTADVTITDKAGKDIITKSGKNMDLEAGGSYQLFTSLGIHLKAMNFVAALIESGAKAAAEALVKGGAEGAQGSSGSTADKAQAAITAGGDAAVAAFGPSVAAVTADLSARQAQAGQNMDAAAEGGDETGKAAAELHQAISSGASNEAIAGAVMALASAAYDTYKDAQKLIEDMLPQIPSIVLWAMKDINATALWSMTLQTKVKDISVEAQNKDINIKAKQNINLEASTKDLNVKATKNNVNITGKQQINVTAEDNNLVIEAKKKKVFVKSADQIFLKCGSASISMAKSGNIVIKGAKININGSGPVTVKGTPIKLN